MDGQQQRSLFVIVVALLLVWLPTVQVFLTLSNMFVHLKHHKNKKSFEEEMVRRSRSSRVHNCGKETEAASSPQIWLRARVLAQFEALPPHTQDSEAEWSRPIRDVGFAKPAVASGIKFEIVSPAWFEWKCSWRPGPTPQCLSVEVMQGRGSTGWV